MDKDIDNRFERVENALAKLINSIAIYNPSPTSATDLVNADSELSHGLEQCKCPFDATQYYADYLQVSVHQTNHAKLVSLRNTSNTLDLQIRETLTLLTDTRRALVNTPSTTFPEHTNPVSYSELLSYARRISKFTLPATYREPEAPIAEASGVAAGQGTSTPKESKSETQTNGTTTPVAISNGVDKDTQMSGMSTAMEVDSGTPMNGAAQTSQETTTSTSLPLGFTQFLNPSAEIPFIPWPSEEAIRKGALASIQILLDQGKDPATFDPEKSAELEAERKKIAEEEDRVKEDRRVEMEEARRREMDRRASVAGASAGQSRGEQERPAVFQLEEFDEDDESE